MNTLGPTSTSELETLKCPKRYHYRYVENLVPKTTSVPLGVGTIWHACAAEGYKALRDGDGRWIVAALDHLAKPHFDRDNLPIILPEETMLAINDMLIYYWDNKGRWDKFDEGPSSLTRSATSSSITG